MIAIGKLSTLTRWHSCIPHRRPSALWWYTATNQSCAINWTVCGNVFVLFIRLKFIQWWKCKSWYFAHSVLQCFGQCWWANQSRSVALVLQSDWQGKMFHCWYILANWNRRPCDYTIARCNKYETRFGRKYYNVIQSAAAVTWFVTFSFSICCQTFPFFGVKPLLLDENGDEIVGAGEGYLVFSQPWPGIMRTIFNNHPRFEETYFSKFPGFYCTGDGEHSTCGQSIIVFGANFFRFFAHSFPKSRSATW